MGGLSWVLFAVGVLCSGEWSMVVCIVGYNCSGGINQLFHVFSNVLFVFLLRVSLAGCGVFGPVGHWLGGGGRAGRPGFLLRQGLRALVLSHPCLRGSAMAFSFSWCGIGWRRRVPAVVTVGCFIFLCGHVGPPGGKSAVSKFSSLTYLIFLGFSACGFKGVECTKKKVGILFRQLSLAFLCLWCIFFKIA